MLHYRVARRQISVEYKSCEIIHKQLGESLLTTFLTFCIHVYKLGLKVERDLS